MKTNIIVFLTIADKDGCTYIKDKLIITTRAKQEKIGNDNSIVQ